MSCNEWKEYRLEDISQIIFSGGTPSTRNEEFWDGDIPWLSSGETRNSFINKTEKTITEEGVKNSSTKLALNGDIVIASAGQGFTRGQVSFCNIDTYINQSLIAIRANNILLNNKYLYYNLKSRYNELRQISDSHSIRGSLTTKMIKDLIIKLPSLEEQEKIANILSSLDDKIELNNEMNKTLEEMAQSIFKRWFVDFEFPNEDGEPYKSSGGEMVDSELGMIPNGWEVVNYINTSDIQYGFAFKSKLFNDKEGKPIIRIRDISNSYTPTYTTEEYNDLYIVTKNDILVGMDGEFKAHIWGGKDSLLNQRVLRIRPKDNNSIAYSYFSIKEPLRYLENSKVGTTVIHLGKKDIDNIKIVYPPNNLISKYRDIADNLINKICENKVEIMELLELRDSLLPKLMSGEIKVN